MEKKSQLTASRYDAPMAAGDQIACRKFLDSFGPKSFSNKAAHQEAEFAELGSRYIISKNGSCFGSHSSPFPGQNAGRQPLSHTPTRPQPYLLLLAQTQRLRGPALSGSGGGSGSGSGTCHLLAAEAKAALREVAPVPGEPLAGVRTECRHFKARLLKSLDISKLKPAPPTELQGWDVQPSSESPLWGVKCQGETHAHGDSRTEATIPALPGPPCPRPGLPRASTSDPEARGSFLPSAGTPGVGAGRSAGGRGAPGPGFSPHPAPSPLSRALGSVRAEHTSELPAPSRRRAWGSRPGERLPWQPRPQPRPAAPKACPAPAGAAEPAAAAAAGPPVPRARPAGRAAATAGARGASGANTELARKSAGRSSGARTAPARDGPRPPGPAPPGQA
ncbi:translation initiation factor IF-2-like [Leopardus geoffroyi]|uniref:translation initiation factor IF-2-like n=1 Tax=Leopardus geoffroyi TaxID=46844 RepID=UPI001E265C2F|nr:translation initiation factor IF-2-like [Leopardus geoffroyi]